MPFRFMSSIGSCAWLGFVACTSPEVGTARGQLIVGEFHVIFVDSLDTLNGDFSATVVPP
ncbi:MAG: hypothetical protein Q8S33_00710 [Myxococcales bacterium]|nr:hypothetical protein [Myxococcales bacterium]MDP3498812.1 hypothetical protein [Myxococcales bacterium]